MFKKILEAMIIITSFLPMAAKAQWREFVDQFGTSMPVDYTSPANDYAKKAAWFAQTRPVLEKYALMVMMELNCRGFEQSEVIHSIKDYEASPVGWGFTAKVVRAGLKMTFTIQPLTPVQSSVSEFVDELEKKWTNKRQVLTESPWLVKELDPKEWAVTNFKKMFLYEPQQPKCQVVFMTGTACTMDLGSGSVSLEPKTAP